MVEKRFTRRDFLESASALAAGLAAPALIPGTALGRDGRKAPGSRIGLGLIGLGGNGSGHLRGFLDLSEAQVLAVCDVDQTRREQARKTAESHYAEQTRSGLYRGCAAYNDFRELLARPDIDAVVVSTPDHWHALVVIAAAKAGKDIYGEKPLGLTVEQGRAMSDTVRRCGVVFQTGSHLRSRPGPRQACELVLNGYLGHVHTIRVVTGRSPSLEAQPMPIPPGFDYEMWLGPAPWEPYTERRCHGTFRFILDYSGGQITDQGAHHIDIAQWAHGSELSGPVEFTGRGEFHKEGLYNTAGRYEVTCLYPDGVKLILTSEGPRSGTIFEGTEGRFYTDSSGIKMADPPSLQTVVIGPNERRLRKSPGHREDFLDCIRNRAEPIAPIEQAHRSVTIAHLGNIAMKLRRTLKWDPKSERFVGDPEADRLLSRSMRGPWCL